MNCGLGNLITLKRHLLQPEEVTATTYDAILQEIATGVAGLFDGHCNRLLARVEGEVCEFSADRSHYILPRFPVEEIEKVELRPSVAAGWIEQADQPVNWNAKTGLIDFETELDVRTTLVRVTYTGGYWFDTTEDDAGTLPTGAALLPESIRLAWVQQTQFNFERRDIRQRKTAGIKDGGGMLDEIKLLPQVEEILRPHRRLALT